MSAIFYASSTGNTAEVSNKISDKLGGIPVIDIADDGLSKINDFNKIILGNSTWGEGELQDDWDELWKEFSDLDFSGKTIALFGLGDQDGYPDNYVDAMGIIYEKVISKGGKIVGQWEIDNDYFFEESTAIVDDMFVGLALDEDTQDELTDDRIEKWCEQIKADIL